MSSYTSTSIRESDKEYLENIRRKIPYSKIPTKISTLSLMVSFIKSNEEMFLDWIKKEES